MGATLVGLVLDRWAYLPELHYRALLRMALTVLDYPDGDRPAATYWGGRELLARTWRQPYPDGDAADDQRRRRSVLHEVTVVCRDLCGEHAIEVVRGNRLPGPGRRQVYRLTVDMEPTYSLLKRRERGER